MPQGHKAEFGQICWSYSVRLDFTVDLSWEGFAITDAHVSSSDGKVILDLDQ